MQQHSLDKISIASPCPAQWSHMKGTDAVRHCGSCKKNVYNLSNMTQTEAQSLLAKNEGDLCVRFYRRKDGTILTSDCPVGVSAIAHKLQRARAAFAARMSLFASIVVTLLACTKHVVAKALPINQPAPVTAVTNPIKPANPPPNTVKVPKTTPFHLSQPMQHHWMNGGVSAPHIQRSDRFQP